MKFEDINLGYIAGGYSAYRGYTADVSNTVGNYCLFFTICVISWVVFGSSIVPYIFAFGLTVVPLMLLAIKLRESASGAGLMLVVIAFILGIVEYVCISDWLNS